MDFVAGVVGHARRRGARGLACLQVSLLALCVSSSSIVAQQVGAYDAAPSPVRSAVAALAQDLGWTLVSSSDQPSIRVELDPGLRPQQYTISGGAGVPILIRGGTAAGCVNGIHGLRLRLRKAGSLRRPLDQAFAVDVTPSFARRGIMVCPYRFGGQQGLEAFGTDTWTFAEWKAYVDELRLCNANVLTVFPLGRWTNPTRWPSTARDERLMNTLVDVMLYCQSVGMKFELGLVLNEVPEPQWREAARTAPHKLVQGSSGWLGTTLSPWTAADDISAGQAHVLAKFVNPAAIPPAVADGFVMMWNDGGGQDFSSQTVGSPAGTGGDPTRFVCDQVASLRSRVMARHPGFTDEGGRFVLWGWFLDSWYHSFDFPATNHLFWSGPFAPEVDAPGRSFGVAVRRSLRSRLGIRDALHMTRSQGEFAVSELCAEAGLGEGWRLCDFEHPDPIRLSLNHGIDRIDSFLYLMHPEEPQYMLPHPNLDYLVTEVRESLQSGAQGITGYRLSPVGRRFSDYATLRLAEDATLTRVELIQDYAALLTEGNPLLRDPVEIGLSELDRARRGYTTQRVHLNTATAHLSSVAIPAHLWRLRDQAILTRFLAILYASQDSARPEQERNDLLLAAYGMATKPEHLHLLRAFSSQWSWQRMAIQRLEDFARRLADGR